MTNKFYSPQPLHTTLSDRQSSKRIRNEVDDEERELNRYEIQAQRRLRGRIHTIESGELES